MRRLIFGIIALMLLFGCTNPPPSQVNQTNQATQKNQTPPPVKIILGNQTNQTISQNLTQQQNQTTPPPPTGLQYTNDPTKLLGVYFIDVSSPGEHGDAVLLVKGDFSMLFDAGPQDAGPKVVDFLRSHDINQLTILVSTNADPRHYGGIQAVANSFKIQQLWWSGYNSGDSNYSALISQISNQTNSVQLVQAGYTTVLDGMNFTVLNPSTPVFSDVNNDAVVTRVADGNVTMLLTSGIQTGAQGRLVNQYGSLIKDQIMEAPYYGVGAGTSNIAFFLNAAKPQTVVISGSSDESTTNGGSRDPFRRLMQQYGIVWYENYVNGTIRITSDGNNYTESALGQGQ